MFLALKEMKKEKKRYFLIIGIVTLISYLVFFLLGLAYGLAKDNTSAVEQWQAHAIVLSSGTNSNLSTSVIDKQVVENLNKNDYSLVNLSRVVAESKKANKSINLALMGIVQEDVAYPKLVEGTLPTHSHEVVASYALKREHDFAIGDTITITNSDKRYTITGFTHNLKYNVASVVFTTPQEAQTFLVREGFASGIILHKEGVFEARDGYDVLTVNDFIMALPGYLPQLLTFSLMIGFLVIIASIILSVFMYILTMQKLTIFAIMKIQGIKNSVLSQSLLFQTFIIATTGIISGVGLTLLTSLVLPKTMPFQSDMLFYVSISVLMIVTMLIGALFSMRSIKLVDPLTILE